MDSHDMQPNTPDEGVSIPRRAIEVGARSLRSALVLPLKATAAVRLIAAPVRLATRLDRALLDLNHIAGGVDAMRDEFVGMRGDILVLDERVEGLRLEMSGLRSDIVAPVADVTPMLDAVRSLDTRLEALGQQLEAVDALALRIGRLGRARARSRADSGLEGSGVVGSAQPTSPEAEAR